MVSKSEIGTTFERDKRQVDATIERMHSEDIQSTTHKITNTEGCAANTVPYPPPVAAPRVGDTLLYLGLGVHRLAHVLRVYKCTPPDDALTTMDLAVLMEPENPREFIDWKPVRGVMCAAYRTEWLWPHEFYR